MKMGKGVVLDRTKHLFVMINNTYRRSSCKLQGDSLARGPKLLSVKNYVIEIMT